MRSTQDDDIVSGCDAPTTAGSDDDDDSDDD